jgi:hypothetical protein
VLVSVTWAIWSSRKKYTQDEYKFQPRKAMEIVEELIRAFEVPVTEKVLQKEESKWCPPAHGTMQLNTEQVLW